MEEEKKAGRPLTYQTEEEIYELFLEYKKSVKDNPRIAVEFHGKDAETCRRPLERPLTMEGFYAYAYDRKGDIHNYFENTQGRYDRFKGICARIRNEIRADQIEGGMVGQYNPSITQRLNGLREQQDINTSGNIQLINIDPLAPDEDGQ